MVMRTSAAAATSRGETASFAPAATRESAREAVRFQTTRGKASFKKIVTHRIAHESETDESNRGLRHEYLQKVKA